MDKRINGFNYSRSRLDYLSTKEITRSKRLAAENKELKEKYKEVKEETARTIDSLKNTLKEIKNTYSSCDLNPNIPQNTLDIMEHITRHETTEFKRA